MNWPSEENKQKNLKLVLLYCKVEFYLNIWNIPTNWKLLFHHKVIDFIEIDSEIVSMMYF